MSAAQESRAVWYFSNGTWYLIQAQLTPSELRIYSETVHQYYKQNTYSFPGGYTPTEAPGQEVAKNKAEPLP